MWYQLNSKLPVDFSPLSFADIVTEYCDDQDLKDDLKAEREKRRVERAAKGLIEDESSSEGGSSDEYLDEIFMEEMLKASKEPEYEHAVTGGELADVVDHFWTANNPFSFIDNSGWTMRIVSQEKEAEGEVERGGPSMTDDLAMVLDEYSHTLHNLVTASVRLPERPIEKLPTAKFLKQHLEAAKKALEARHPPGTIAILSGAMVTSSMGEESNSDDDEKAKRQRQEKVGTPAPVPLAAARPPPPRAPVYKDPGRPPQQKQQQPQHQQQRQSHHHNGARSGAPHPPRHGEKRPHSPPRHHHRSPRRQPDAQLCIEDFQIDVHGSNIMPNFKKRGADGAQGAAMNWPGQLYIGERSAAAIREQEQQQVAEANEAAAAAAAAHHPPSASRR